MMPPTGLTLFVHGSVIFLKAVSRRFKLPFCENSYSPEPSQRHRIVSMVIVLLIFLYVVVLIAGFVFLAMKDDHATWRFVVFGITELKEHASATIQKETQSPAPSREISPPTTPFTYLTEPPNI